MTTAIHMGNVSQAGWPTTNATRGAAESSTLPDPHFSAGCLNDTCALVMQETAKLQALSLTATGVEISARGAEQRADAQHQQKALADAAKATSGRGFWDSMGKLASDAADDVGSARIADAGSDFADNVGEMGASPQFWRDVMSGAGKIAEVTAVVGGAGLGAVAIAAGVGAKNNGATALGIAGVALSIGGVIVSETHCFGKSSDAIGTACSLGGGVAGAVGVASAGLKDADKVTRAFVAVGGASAVIGGGAGIISGTATVRGAFFERARTDAEADAADAQEALRADSRAMGRLADFVAGLEKTHTKTVELLNETAQTEDKTRLFLAAPRA